MIFDIFYQCACLWTYLMCLTMLRFEPDTFPHSGQGTVLWSCWCFASNRWLMNDFGFAEHLPNVHTQEPSVSMWTLLVCCLRYSLAVVAYLHSLHEKPSTGRAFNVCLYWCCLSLDFDCRNFPQSSHSHFFPFAPWKWNKSVSCNYLVFGNAMHTVMHSVMHIAQVTQCDAQFDAQGDTQWDAHCIMHIA